MEPGDDDGTTREAAGGITQITRGRFVYTSFPVRWDDEGRCAAVALQAHDVENDVRTFVIVAPGGVNGCACADCAPHDQDGPIPVQIAARIHGDRSETASCAREVPCATCKAAAGEPCRPVKGGDPYEGYAHKPREVLARVGIVSCTHCGAAVGEPCVSAGGKTLGNVHSVRTRTADRRPA